MTRFAADAVALWRRAPNAQVVRFGREVSHGPVDIEDRVQADAGGEHLVRVTVVTVPAAHFASIARQSTILVGTDRTEYLVRDIELTEDGLTKELLCAEATA